MAARDSIKTTPKEIIDYWAELLDWGDLGVDFEDARERCWRCRTKFFVVRKLPSVG